MRNSSPEALARDEASLFIIGHVLAGIYLWDFFISLDFEWGFIRGHRRFNWPLIPYFLGRYFALGLVIIGLISLDDTTRKTNCHTLMVASDIFGGGAWGLSSINLAIRTMVVWNMKWSCVVPLCLLSMAQWAFIIRDAFSLRTTGQSGQSCEIIQISISGQSAKLSLGIFFDFVALILIVYKIFGFNHGTIKRSQLISILFQDGMIYFVASIIVNIPSLVLTVLQLSIPMAVLSILIAAIFSTIVASRVVRHLSNFSTDRPAIYMTTTKPPVNRPSDAPHVIQIQMETMSTSDTPLGATGVRDQIKTDSYV